MMDDTQKQIFELYEKQFKETQRQTELYEKSIAMAEQKAMEYAKLRIVEEETQKELKKQNELKEYELNQQKMFHESVLLLVEQNKITISEIENFFDKMNSKDDPVVQSLKILLEFFHIVQIPIMIEVIKQLGVHDNQSNYIDMLSKMATQIGSARTNINQNSGMNVGGNFNNSGDFKSNE